MTLNAAVLTNGRLREVIGRLKNDLKSYGLERGPFVECAK